jgi:hypothetical protein
MLGQAAAGIQGRKMFWIPVFTGMTNYAEALHFQQPALPILKTIKTPTHSSAFPNKISHRQR